MKLHWKLHFKRICASYYHSCVLTILWGASISSIDILYNKRIQLFIKVNIHVLTFSVISPECYKFGTVQNITLPDNYFLYVISGENDGFPLPCNDRELKDFDKEVFRNNSVTSGTSGGKKTRRKHDRNRSKSATSVPDLTVIRLKLQKLQCKFFFIKPCWVPNINPFPHTDAIWCLCIRWILKTLCHNKQISSYDTLFSSLFNDLTLSLI